MLLKSEVILDNFVGNDEKTLCSLAENLPFNLFLIQLVCLYMSMMVLAATPGLLAWPALAWGEAAVGPGLPSCLSPCWAPGHLNQPPTIPSSCIIYSAAVTDTAVATIDCCRSIPFLALQQQQYFWQRCKVALQ